MPRVLWVAVVLLLLTFASSTGRSARPTQAQDATSRAADTASRLADLEIASDWDGLYAALHPDAQAVVPFEALAGWYANDFLPRGPYPIEIVDVRFVSWTWPVTGVTYSWTAEVAYRQTFWDDGAEVTLDADVHLVEVDGDWRWFFGADMAFLADQIARYTSVGANTAPFSPSSTDLPGTLFADLDAFWSAVFAEQGLTYSSPGYVAFTGEWATSCGIASATFGPASYCPLDGTIYWETAWMNRLRAEQGNAAWGAVIAHEWGHHLQALAGLTRSLAPEGDLERYPIEMELQADCLSGAYAQDAEWRGLFAAGDVAAALALAFASGDEAGVPWYDAAAHGTPDMRATSFRIGYNDGTAGCGLV